MTKGQPAASPLSTVPDLFRLPARWLYLLLFLVTALAYIPVFNAGFIWDDAGHVTRPDLQSVDGLRRIWFEPGATQQYYPVLHTAFWIEHQLWGEAPLGYHALNVLLHALAACLVLKLLRRLAVPGASVAALLFALHPVCVESVAWVSEQKNTLSTVFYLAAALAYLRFDETRQPCWYVLASVRFALALLTKSVTATLPAALLVILWWRNSRAPAGSPARESRDGSVFALNFRRDVLPLVPWFILAIGFGLVTASIERTQIGAQGSDFSLDPLQRLLLAGRVAWFYFGKLLWPANLVFVYPHWTLDAGDVEWWTYLLAALAVFTWLAWWTWKRSQRGPLAIALLFVGTLFPALGFFNAYPFLYSYVADHFQYLASIAIFAAIGALVVALLDRTPRRRVIQFSTAAILVVLGILTFRQTRMYRDVFTLYETTLERNPACWMAHNNLAEALANSGRIDEAIPHLQQALKLRPDFAEAENNFGNDLTSLGRFDAAIAHLQHAIQLQPKFAEAHNNLGIALMRSGRSSEGIAEFERALQLKPTYAVARFNHGLALASTGHPAEAIADFAAAVKLDPQYADAELNWGIALTVTDQVIQAIPHFERAQQLNPNSTDVQTSYGRALLSTGRYDEAIGHLRQAIELNPASADAHYQLALALRQTGRLDEAQQHLAEARRLSAQGP